MQPIPDHHCFRQLRGKKKKEGEAKRTMTGTKMTAIAPLQRSTERQIISDEWKLMCFEFLLLG
jgi:hypothetical protein